MTYTVAQLGARMHYAVPRVLAAAGLLDHFYTDICAVKGWPRLVAGLPQRLAPAPARRLLDRRPAGVPPQRITAFTSFGLSYLHRLRRATLPADTTAAHLWGSRTFCRLVRHHASRRRSLRRVYAFNSAALELFEAARAIGGHTILEQTIAPRALEDALLEGERESFPEWEGAAARDSHGAAFAAREQAEWELADLIVCGSEFVRAGIAACGGPAARCVVVPYGVDAALRIPARPPRAGPLRVLVAGAVGLRKGSPHVLDAARALAGVAAIRMVGRFDVQEEARAKLAEVVELVGPVPRSEMIHHFGWADVFLLPSLCEGSATVVYEALAAGLPVVCTANTGSVVREGIEGCIIPIRNPEAIIAALELLAKDPDLRLHMSRNAIRRAHHFSVEAYGRRLIGALFAQPVPLTSRLAVATAPGTTDPALAGP